MVSARFIGYDIIVRGSLLESIVFRSRKLAKLEIQEVIIDLAYVSALEKVFMINQKPAESEAEESKITGEVQVLANKGVTSHGEYFRNRLKELVLSNIQFVGETEVQRNLCIGKFFYIFNKFSSLETITLQSISNAPQVIKCLANSPDKAYL